MLNVQSVAKVLDVLWFLKDKVSTQDMTKQIVVPN